MLESGYLEVQDTFEDPFFCDAPLVIDTPAVRFYAGAAVCGPSGQYLGTLCVLDTRPRTLTPAQRDQLESFARLVEFEINEHRRDETTQLPDARQLGSVLAQQLDSARWHETTLALVKIQVAGQTAGDISGGHAARDEMLQTVAEQLHAQLVPGDYLGRLAETCFALIVAGGESVESITERVDAMLASLELPLATGGLPLSLTLAAGGARFPEDGSSVDELFDRARDATRYAGLYQESGKTVFFHQITDNPLSRADDLAERLDAAIRYGEVVQHYQPVIDCASDAVIGVEALARWSDPFLGSVSPGEFIPLAESDPGLRQALTELTIRQACEQLAVWQLRGIDWYIAVNIPGAEFYRAEFADFVLATLDAHGVDPDRLWLELTETSVINDFDRVLATIHRLRDHGIRFALDDFGTGYSSLTYLRCLPLDEVKIDRSFIRDMDRSAQAVELVTHIIGIARTLEMAVVAEGIETDAQYQRLRDLGCQFGQGFGLGRPDRGAALTRHMNH